MRQSHLPYDHRGEIRWREGLLTRERCCMIIGMNEREKTRSVASRPLTVEEWQARLSNAREILRALERDVAVLIASADHSDSEVLRAIHSAAGNLGKLDGHAALAQRRIDRGLT